MRSDGTIDREEPLGLPQVRRSEGGPQPRSTLRAGVQESGGQPEAVTQGIHVYARRGDAVEAYIRATRELYRKVKDSGYPGPFDAIDGLLDDYRLRADTGTPLLEEFDCDVD